jgi:hypothetical protein
VIAWAASYPRSGNTFLLELLSEAFGFDIASAYPQDGPPIRGAKGGGGYRPQAEIAPSARTWFVKIHDLPGDRPWPAIYLVRDGRDALVSYTHFTLAERGETSAPGEPLFLRTLRDLILNESPFGTWSESVRAWTSRPQCAVARFEDLVRQPLEVVAAALRLIGFDPVVSAAFRMPTFAELKRESPEGFRVGRTGSWREEMPADLEGLFWERHGDTARGMGYER